MTLPEQIREIASRWINPVFAEKINLPSVINSLAIEGFKKLRDGSTKTTKFYEDCEAINIALNLLDKGGIPLGTPGFFL